MQQRTVSGGRKVVNQVGAEMKVDQGIVYFVTGGTLEYLFHYLNQSCRYARIGTSVDMRHTVDIGATKVGITHASCYLISRNDHVFGHGVEFVGEGHEVIKPIWPFTKRVEKFSEFVLFLL